MSILQRRRQPFDETLPDGATVLEAIRRLTNDPEKPVAPLPSGPIFDRNPNPVPVDNSAPLPISRNALPAPIESSVNVDPITRDVSPQTPDLSQMGAPPVMIGTHHGRPTSIVGGNDPLANDQQLLTRQMAYKAPRSTKDALISTALGFLNRGIPGAIGGLANYELNPDVRDQMAGGRDMADTRKRIQGEMLRRKTANDALNEQLKLEQGISTVNLNRARTDNLTHPPAKPGQHIMTKDGWALLDPATGAVKPILDPKTGEQAQGQPTGAKTEWVHDENGIAHKYENGKDTGQLDPGRNLVNVPGYGLMTPGTKLTADSTVENRDYQRTKDVIERGDKAREVATRNAARQANIKQLQDAAANLGPAPPVYIPKTDEYGRSVPGAAQVVNPAYQDWQRQKNEYDNQARSLNAQMETAPTQGPITPQPLTRGNRNLTIDGAIDHFKKKKGRAPTDAEIANMRAALPQ